MFRTTGNKGFQITFSNGYTLSVQFGPGNYVTDRSSDYLAPMKTEFWESKDAKLASWSEEETAATKPTVDESNETAELTKGWVSLSEHDTVSGWATPDQVAKLVWYLANLRSSTKASEVLKLADILKHPVLERLDFSEGEE